MLKLFKSKHHPILGIDVSSTSVRILELSNKNNKYCVEAYACAELPEAAMEGNTIKNSQVIADIIKNMITPSLFSSKIAALAVPDSLTISKIIQINEGLNEAEMEEIVISEADKYIPYPIDEINIDFNVLGASAKNSAMLDVLIVASRTENVNNRVEPVTLAGIEPKIVDIESFAVERTVQLLSSIFLSNGEKKNIAIIDMGSVYTHLYVFHNMKIIFSRDEEFGGKQLIESIMQHYGLPQQQALEILRKINVPDDYENVVLEPFKDLIFLQIKRALQFFFSTSNHSTIDQIFLAGGLARLPGIDQLVQEQVNIPTLIADPISQMNCADRVNRELLERDSPKLLVACGLALRQIG